MKNITIRNNLIKTAATYDILVSNAKNVKIEGDILSDTNNANPFYVPEKLSIHKQGAIVIKASDDVTLKDNSFSHPGAFCDADVYHCD